MFVGAVFYIYIFLNAKNHRLETRLRPFGKNTAYIADNVPVS